MDKKLVIVGNWKMYKTLEETKAFVEKFKNLYDQNFTKIPPKCEFGIAPNFINMAFLHEKTPISLFTVAQNMSEHVEGAFTGETSVKMIKSVQAKMVILGHSERRTFFNESDEIINKKVLLALENNLTPIVCVGETLKEYENNQRESVVKKQLTKALKDVKDLSKVIIAYEPVWAIGTGKTASPADAQKMCALIRQMTHKDVLIQYGGSVNVQNIKELMMQQDIDGALVGSASLEAESMIKLLTLNS